MGKGANPQHIAIIMDGNGRWAQLRGQQRVEGHRAGVDAVKRTVMAASKLGVKYLTLYTFSTENWNRPESEVKALMALMAQAIIRETEELMSAGVRVKLIGNKEDLPVDVVEQFDELERASGTNEGLTLILAISYGARWEIVRAAKRLAVKYSSGEIDDIDESCFEAELTTSGVPDPDLLIRTGGDCRISNFLLWQCAYAELRFIKKYWPDFGEEDLRVAIEDFAGRERRFGKTGEQVREDNEHKS